MTSKGPVQTGPKQAAEKPDPMDWRSVSCIPSPSCLPHSSLQKANNSRQAGETKGQHAKENLCLGAMS